MRVWRRVRTAGWEPVRARLAAIDRYGIGLLQASAEWRWIVAGFVSSLVVLIAALAYLTAPGGPRPPYEPVARLEAVRQPVLDRDRDVLFLRAGGRVRAFDASELQPRFCAKSGRLESADGRVWSQTGQSLNGGPSLHEHHVIVDDDVIYVDLTKTVPAPTGSNQSVQPECFARRR